MKMTDRQLSDKECREILMEIIEMLIDAYMSPIRKGFNTRGAQVGFDLMSILRRHNIICPGDPNGQERMEL